MGGNTMGSGNTDKPICSEASSTKWLGAVKMKSVYEHKLAALLKSGTVIAISRSWPMSAKR
ncbi:hypothetical protein AKJ18_29150 [Vibrio xuii]|nr:hypothetical protein AKJ18_29150 [Vibrio xuii]